SPGPAWMLNFRCSFVLGVGANAIVAAGHALVADVASHWRNAALNLLDICFGLGLAALPLVVQSVQRRGGLDAIFWCMSITTGILLAVVLFPKFPTPTHPEAASFA